MWASMAGAVVAIDPRRGQRAEAGEAKAGVLGAGGGDEGRKAVERRRLLAGADDGEQPGGHEPPPQWMITS